MRLKDKVAIITGAGSGMGQAEAILFAKEGAKVVVNDDHEDEAIQTVKMIEKEGLKDQAIPIRADVSKEKEVKIMVEETIKRFGKIDILVNNAGIYRGHTVPETTTEEWYEVMDTNLMGPFLCCKYVIPHMLKQKKGKIINISSIGGLIALEGSAPYNASKGGLIAFTKGLAMDYAAKGINVNCVCPGWTDTPMVRALVTDPNIKKALLADIPCGRFARDVDQAYLVLWLASDESDYMHGSIVVNDGGWMVR